MRLFKLSQVLRFSFVTSTLFLLQAFFLPSCLKATNHRELIQEENRDDSLIITSITGTVSHGANITISGAAFGTVPQAAPLIWDDFENGTNNTDLANGWVRYHDPRVSGGLYSNEDAYTGNLSAFNQISKLTGGRHEFATSYQKFPATDTVYCSYMYKFTVTGDNYGVMKLTRITSDYSGPVSHTPHYNGPGDFSIQQQTHASWLYGNYNVGSGAKQQTLGGGMAPDKWHRVDMFKILSTPGEPNGQVSWVINNIQGYSSDTLVTRDTGFTFKENSVLLGLMNANVRNDGFFKLFIDNVYVNNTQARVEVGNAATFSTCTVREIQIPTAWSENAITVKVNSGRLPAGTAYLYVVDKNGTVNTNGYPVTLP